MTEFRLPTAPASKSAVISSSAASGVGRKTFWPVAIGALIFWASSRSFVPSPGFTPVDDKFTHFAVYGLLATLVCRIGRDWRAAVWSLMVVSAFGASDEWHQSFVPGRSPEVGDWIADTAGAALAVALYAGWAQYRRVLEMPLHGPKRRVEKN